jgi:hypothetical protein
LLARPAPVPALAAVKAAASDELSPLTTRAGRASKGKAAPATDAAAEAGGRKRAAASGAADAAPPKRGKPK